MHIHIFWNSIAQRVAGQEFSMRHNTKPAPIPSPAVIAGELGYNNGPLGEANDSKRPDEER